MDSKTAAKAKAKDPEESAFSRIKKIRQMLGRLMDNGRIVNGKMHHGMIGHGTIPRSPTQPKEKKIKERRAKEKASMARTTASPMERTAQLSLQILLRSARRLSLRTFLSWQPRRRMKHSSFSP